MSTDSNLGPWVAAWTVAAAVIILSRARRGSIGAGLVTAFVVSFALGYWFYTLAAVTLMAMLASLAESLAITAVLLLLGVGSAFLGIFYTVGGSTWQDIAGYVTMASAVAAFYAGSAMLLANTWGRTVLPLGKYSREANVPGGRPVSLIQFASGEPGATAATFAVTFDSL